MEGAGIMDKQNVRYMMYLRKSRADAESGSVEEVLSRHYDILQRFAAEKLGGAVKEDMIFREIVSGETIDDRPEMKKLLRRISSEDITGVLAVDPQRLSRGDLSDCGTVIRSFRYTGTLVITPQKTFDLQDKFDRKLFEMELMRGNDYLEYVREIMHRGRIASVNQGNHIASSAPFGYRKVRDGKTHTLSPGSDAGIVRLIFELWTKEKLSISAIADRLNELHISPPKAEMWCSQSIRSILRNPVYTGKIRWNYRRSVKKFMDGCVISSRPVSPENEWILTDGKHEAIISAEMFSDSLARFGTSPRTKRASAPVNPFAGLIRCSCGSAMVYQKPKNSSPRLHCISQKKCGSRSTLYSAAEKTILDAMKAVLPDISTCITEISRSADTLADTLRKEITSLHTRQEKLCSLLEQGVYSEELFRKRNAALEARITALTAALSDEEEKLSPALPEKQSFSLHEALFLFQDNNIPADAKNLLLRSFVKKIVYSCHSDYHDKWHSAPFSLDIYLL